MASPSEVLKSRKTMLDYDLLQAEFERQKRSGLGQDPAAIKIANEIAVARATGDQQRLMDLQMSAKLLDRGVYMTPDGQTQVIGGYPDALSMLEFGKEQGAQMAKDAHEPGRAGMVENAKLQQQLNYGPKIEGAERAATLEADRIGDLNKEFAGTQKTIPVIDELKGYNEVSPSIPYAGKTQWMRRLMPGTSEAESAVDLMRQARLDLAAPLAKQLGVNPTDKDFQASLDRIFDIEASRESRQKQIEALESRILARQQQLAGALAEDEGIDYSAFGSVSTDQLNGYVPGNSAPPPSLMDRAQAEFDAKKTKPKTGGRLRYNPATGEFE